MEETMQRLVDDPEATLHRAADHVLTGYAWFYSDRNVTVPAAGGWPGDLADTRPLSSPCDAAVCSRSGQTLRTVVAV